jgi:uncharacterized protein YeaO (DUF488 family)
MMIKTAKTIYDKLEKSDGKRILVMRFWPRGVKKDKIDLWMRDLGTDKDVIKKWKTGEISWNQFAKEYKKSLRNKQDLLLDLAKLSAKGDITLLCSCKDAEHCHRTLLAEGVRKIAERRTPSNIDPAPRKSSG